MEKIAMCTVIISFLLASCGGKKAAPVAQYFPGDDNLTCHQIRLSIADNQNKTLSLIPKQKKTGKNVALGAAGLVFMPIWLFMDFSEAERIEVQALQQRNDWLHTLASEKKCGAMPLELRFRDQ